MNVFSFSLRLIAGIEHVPGVFIAAFRLGLCRIQHGASLSSPFVPSPVDVALNPSRHTSVSMCITWRCLIWHLKSFLPPNNANLW